MWSIKKRCSNAKKVKTGNGKRQTVNYTDYVVTIKRRDGNLESLIFTEDTTKYDYSRIGDYVKYHCKPHVKGFEKYNKRFNEILFCTKCSTINDAIDFYCHRCGCPLLKDELLIE